MFWVLVGVLILITLVVLCVPLLRTSREVAGGEDGRLNISVYKQQLRELEADRDRGLVTEDQMEQARVDIERALLSEVPEQPQARYVPGHRDGWLPAAVASVLVIVVSVSLYLFIGNPQAVDGVDGVAPAPGNAGMSSVQEMVASLERRLEQNPDDTEGWLMLARSYSVLGRHEEAAEVLERLRGMVGDEPGLLVRYANALALANNGQFEGRPTELIRQVLEQDPANPSAIWFAGLAANQRGDYREAVDYWERLLPRLEGEPEALERLQGMIARARNAMPDDAAATADGDEAGSPGVTVQVRLAAGLEDRVGGDDALYVFARAADGPAMPLAVAKHRAGDLPLEVRLDDTSAMTPNTRLSGHDSVTLVARVSKSGQPGATSGDLQGEVTDVAVPTNAPVELVIDSPVP